MLKLRFSGYVLSCVAFFALAACGGSRTPLGVPSAAQGNATRDAYSVCVGSSDERLLRSSRSRRGMFLPSMVVHTAGKREELPKGLTPANLQAAYELPSLTKGSGQIVALVEVCDNPNVAADQAAYRSQFGLPSGAFYKFNEYGQQADYPPARKPLGLFIDVDVEMVAAICPNCTIYLIEANGEDQTDFQTAEATAVSLGAHIVNNAWGCNYSGCVDKPYFDAEGVTYVGLGAVPQPDEVYPADFDTVVAVGGTYLSQGGGGKRGWTESIWKGAGGGCFSDVPKPKWQSATSCSGRVSNDVSMDAMNLLAYDSYDGLGQGTNWLNIGGTGVPTGMISATFALAGDAAHQDGGCTFWQKTHRKHLYRLECEGSCTYGERFSFPDGWGSPHGLGAF